jgi:hypothetical protein
MVDNYKPWVDLSPCDLTKRWWRITEIIDEKYAPNKFDLRCCYIIQDGNMNGNFWYIACWYLYCPNRYTNILYEYNWMFDKKLSEISEGDIVSLLDNPEIKFKAYNCKNSLEEQKQFCKILERIF